MATEGTRVLAVDWSGAKTRPEKKIWLAEVVDGRMTRLEGGRNREDLTDHLVEEAHRDPRMIVGLDFAFSFPEWYCRALGAREGADVWHAATERGEEWLSLCREPFWGRGGTKRPEREKCFRETETTAAREAAGQPKSVFQIAGPGAVGTGSIRGMPHLLTLRKAGFAIFPFDPPSLPLVLEIYPRTLTGPVVKSDRAARLHYLQDTFGELDPGHLSAAAGSEDAFDAAVSAAVMARHLDELLDLERPESPIHHLEGAIWYPAGNGPWKPPVGRERGSGLQGEAGDCPFCAPDPRPIAQSERGLAIRDRYPVSEGHTLVIPTEHVPSLYELAPEVQAELWRLVETVRSQLMEELSPDGFTIGVNDGRAAGQTVEHAHIHVIPRFEGDVDDPRGGIRHVRPDRAAYWE